MAVSDIVDGHLRSYTIVAHKPVKEENKLQVIELINKLDYKSSFVTLDQNITVYTL